MKILVEGQSYQLETNEGKTDVVLQFMRQDGRVVAGGLTNEELIKVLAHRLRFLNAKQSCAENEQAIGYLDDALAVLEKRAGRAGGLNYQI